MKIFRSTPIALILAALSLTACVNSSPEGEAIDSEIINAGIETFVNVEDATEFLPTWSKENTVVYHMIGDPDDMHPANGNSATRSFIHGYTQSYVMASDLINLKGGRPDVVKGHPTVSADELQFTYELMDEPTWDNGEQLTVADVIFTFKAIKCPLTNNPHAKPYLENLKTITQDPANPRKFTLVMKKKYIQNIVFLTDYPLLQESYWDKGKVLQKYTFEQLDAMAAGVSIPKSITVIKGYDDKGNRVDPVNLWSDEGKGGSGYGNVVAKCKNGDVVEVIKKGDQGQRLFVKKADGKSGWLSNFFIEEKTLEAPKSAGATPKDLNNWATEFNSPKYSRNPEFLVGLGPYRFEDWKPGQSYTLVKKENHWTSKLKSPSEYHTAYPERIIFKNNSDPNSQILEFKSQAMDASTWLDVKMMLDLQADPNFNQNYHSRFTNTYNYSYMAFNCRPDGVEHKKLFEDKRVRRAIAMLVPVDEINVVLNNGKNTRMVGPVSPLKEEYNKDLALVEFNLEAAKKLLDEAGWKDTDADNIRDKVIDGQKTKFEFDLHYMTSTVTWKDMAQMISEALYEAGVKCNITPLDFAIHYDRARNHKFDAMLASWAGSSVPEDFTQIWHTSSWASKGSNFGGFGNVKSDALIDSIKYTLNDAKRHGMVKELQSIIYEDQPYVFLYAANRRNVIHKRFGNADMYFERPGVLINNWKLLEGKSASTTSASPQ